MKVAIDIDGVIDRIPEFLSFLSNHLLSEGHEVIILTSRANEGDVISKSLLEVKNAGINFSGYYFLPDVSKRIGDMIPQDLNWFEKQIWQKAEYCQNNDIDLFFEDDQKTAQIGRAHV